MTLRRWTLAAASETAVLLVASVLALLAGGASALDERTARRSRG